MESSYHCNEVTTAGACAGDYVITRTFTATDDFGNAQALRRRSRLLIRQPRVHVIPSDYTAGVLTSTNGPAPLPLTTVEKCSYHCRRGYYCWRLCSDYVIRITFRYCDDYGNATSATRTVRLLIRQPQALFIGLQQVLTITQWMTCLRTTEER